MFGHGVLAASNMFLLDEYEETINFHTTTILDGSVIGIPRKNSSFWIIYWFNNNVMPQIPTNVSILR